MPRLHARLPGSWSPLCWSCCPLGIPLPPPSPVTPSGPCVELQGFSQFCWQQAGIWAPGSYWSLGSYAPCVHTHPASCRDTPVGVDPQQALASLFPRSLKGPAASPQPLNPRAPLSDSEGPPRSWTERKEQSTGGGQSPAGPERREIWTQGGLRLDRSWGVGLGSQDSGVQMPSSSSALPICSAPTVIAAGDRPTRPGHPSRACRAKAPVPSAKLQQACKGRGTGERKAGTQDLGVLTEEC